MYLVSRKPSLVANTSISSVRANWNFLMDCFDVSSMEDHTLAQRSPNYDQFDLNREVKHLRKNLAFINDHMAILDLRKIIQPTINNISYSSTCISESEKLVLFPEQYFHSPEFLNCVGSMFRRNEEACLLRLALGAYKGHLMHPMDHKSFKEAYLEHLRPPTGLRERDGTPLSGAGPEEVFSLAMIQPSRYQGITGCTIESFSLNLGKLLFSRTLRYVTFLSSLIALEQLLFHILDRSVENFLNRCSNGCLNKVTRLHAVLIYITTMQ